MTKFKFSLEALDAREVPAVIGFGKSIPQPMVGHFAVVKVEPPPPVFAGLGDKIKVEPPPPVVGTVGYPINPHVAGTIVPPNWSPVFVGR